MHTNVNLAAPIGVVLFLATALTAVILTFGLLASLVIRRFFLAKLALLALLIIASGYFAVMLLFSFESRSEVLARGQEKHFCEVDCHLAYSIVAVVQAKALGSAGNEIAANGTFFVITVQTRFDETTIRPTRGNGLLYPNPRVVTVVDSNGQRYLPQGNRFTGTPISTPLRPNENYTTTFIFDLPSNIDHPTLLINEGDWITRLIIGHENSLAHKKTSFQI